MLELSTPVRSEDTCAQDIDLNGLEDDAQALSLAVQAGTEAQVNKHDSLFVSRSHANGCVRRLRT
jgi:hypothetical protein